MFPEARKEALIVTELDNELIVYDEKRRRAILLNPTASRIWQNCDGRSSLEEIVVRMSEFQDIEAGAMAVQLGLKRLAHAGLLEANPREVSSSPSVTRRVLLSRLGVAATAGLLLPAVTLLAAPTPAMASSTIGGGGDGGGGDDDNEPEDCSGRRGPVNVCGGDVCRDQFGFVMRDDLGRALTCQPTGFGGCECRV